MKKRWNCAQFGMPILAFTLTVFILQAHNISVYADELSESTTETTLEECPEEQSDESEETIGTATESSEESEENFTEQPEEESIEITEIFDDATETPTEETLDAESSLGIMNVRPRIAVDSEKPVIHKDTVYISNNSVTIGDTVTVGVKVTDNFEINYVNVTLFREDEAQSLSVRKMNYNKENGLYEYSFIVSDNIGTGKWYLSQITATDTTGNYTSEVFNKNLCTFLVINPSADSEKPVIDYKSLRLDKRDVIYGDKVTIHVRATDNIGITNITISLINDDTSQDLSYLRMSYNSNLEMYELTLDVDKMSSGKWYINFLTAEDAGQNFTYITLPDKECYFNVINNNIDSEKPVFHKSTFSITPFLAQTDDKVKVSVRITDNIALSDVRISFFNMDTYQDFSYTPMIYNSEIDRYEYEFLIDDTIAEGHWSVQITASDSIGNYNSLSGHYFFATDSGKELHKWDNGYISKPATATEDGIKTYICTVCYDTKEEIIPATGEEDGDDENPTDPGDNETEVEIPETHPDTSKPDSKPDPDDNISNGDENNNQHVWIPTTPEEAKRYECYGKEKVHYMVLDDNPYPVTIENAMQGSKCFEVFENASNGFNIGRTYNIYPKGNISNISTGEKVKITLTIPDELCKEGRIFKMICVSGNGIPTVLDDLDESNGSITFETDKYYAFALVYSDIK